MANQPPVGRWMRMATFRPIPNPTQDPPSPQPAAPRPVPGRTFTAVPFRPAVPTAPIPAAVMPTAPVTAPPRQVTPRIPAVTTIRPASARLAAGTNGIPPPQGANNTTFVSNGVPSPRQTPTAAAVTNGVTSPQRAQTAAAVTDSIPSPQRAPTAAAVTNGIPSSPRVPNEIRTPDAVPSPQRGPNASITNGALPQQSPLQAPIAAMPNVKPSPQRPLPSVAVEAAPLPPKSQVTPSASPAQQTITSLRNVGNGGGAQQLISPQIKSPPPPPPPTSTNITSPKIPYTTQVYTPKSPSQQSPQQPLAAFRSPTASPSPQKQQTSPPNFTSNTSVPAPRTVTFSTIQSLSSPSKFQLSPAYSTPQIPSPNKSNPSDRTPPQSPKIMSLAPPPSPLNLPPPQLRSDTEQHTKISPEPEQKSILFQQSSDEHKSSSTPNHKSPKITKHETDIKPTTKEKHPHHKKHPDLYDTNRSIITIAGENRGALMNLTRPRTTPPHQQFPGNPHKLTNPNSSESDESSGRSSNNGKSKSRDAVSTAMKSFMNSNVQGINNSLMFNSSITHHDPGVHVALSRKHKGRDHGNGELIRHYKEQSDGNQS